MRKRRSYEELLKMNFTEFKYILLGSIRYHLSEGDGFSLAVSKTGSDFQFWISEDETRKQDFESFLDSLTEEEL